MTRMTNQLSRETGERRPGIAAMGERILSSDWTALLAFTLLLGTFHLTTWQAFLAIIVFVQRTTNPPEWLVKERATGGETGERV